jgi:hypothetical protein
MKMNLSAPARPDPDTTARILDAGVNERRYASIEGMAAAVGRCREVLRSSSARNRTGQADDRPYAPNCPRPAEFLIPPCPVCHRIDQVVVSGGSDPSFACTRCHTRYVMPQRL